MNHEAYLAHFDVPSDRAVDFLDARDLPPPEPLQETMTRLADLDGETVFVQLNDRVPQFLFPKLDEQGVAYETVETDDGALTAIWDPTDD
ncbi:DUF2249 domain-containing protein [Halobellus clavatus]|jgi:hypothetical protein|uniref:Uncharacterized conserved protein n=1 Tax=Halobellus clavatus TaxID=660517 RepID=A0A1H3FNA0_9EURY|nr:Uncharacterized conserved protein [Halobellus clavatus]